MGFPSGSVVKYLPPVQETQDTWIAWLFRKIPWRRKQQPTPVFLPGKSHGQRSLADFSLWGHKRARHNWAHTDMQWLMRSTLLEVFLPCMRKESKKQTRGITCHMILKGSGLLIPSHLKSNFQCKQILTKWKGWIYYDKNIFLILYFIIVSSI